MPSQNRIKFLFVFGEMVLMPNHIHGILILKNNKDTVSTVTVETGHIVETGHAGEKGHALSLQQQQRQTI